MSKKLKELESRMSVAIIERDKAKDNLAKKQLIVNNLRLEISETKDTIKSNQNVDKVSMLWDNEKIDKTEDILEFVLKTCYGFRKNVDGTLKFYDEDARKLTIEDVYTLFEKEILTRSKFSIEREIFIINRMARGMSRKEVGEVVGLGSARVSQILKGVRNKVRYFVREKYGFKSGNTTPPLRRRLK